MTRKQDVVFIRHAFRIRQPDVVVLVVLAGVVDEGPVGDVDGDEIAGRLGDEFPVEKLRAAIDPGAGWHGGTLHGVLDPLVGGRAAGVPIVFPLDVDVDAGGLARRGVHFGKVVAEAAGFRGQGVEFAGRLVAEQGEGEVEMGGGCVGDEQRLMDLAILVDEEEFEQPAGHVDAGGNADLAGLLVEGDLADPEGVVVDALDVRFHFLDGLVRKREGLWLDG